MPYKGKFTPTNPEKYHGKVESVVYRSLWERNVMKNFDRNVNVLAWASEELAIPYKSPLDGKFHRYYPDFLAKVKTKDGIEKKYLIEVKPSNQCEVPKLPKSGRKTKAYKAALMRYAINQTKWEYARKWCQRAGYEFRVMTEIDCG